MVTGYLHDSSARLEDGAARYWKLSGNGPKLRSATATPPSSRHASATRVFRLDARFETGGVWSGVETLIEAAYLDLRGSKQNQLLDEHDYELYMILLKYRDEFYPKYMNLTDTAPARERTRRYAVERVYRVVHGLVGLVLKWQLVSDNPGRWVVIVQNFDQAQHLARRFFTELARRQALHDRTNLDVIVETRLDPAQIEHQFPGLRADPTASQIEPPESKPSTGFDLTTEMVERLDREMAATPLLLEQYCFALLAYHGARGDHIARARLAFAILPAFVSYAYYYEGKPLIDIFMPYFDTLVGDSQLLRGQYVGYINSCYGGAGEPRRLPEVVKERALPYITTPHVLASMYYILAIYYIRAAEVRDLSESEEYFRLTLEQVRLAKDHPDTKNYAFLKVFMDNGLALLRVRQGRHQEAIQLCVSGYDQLMRELDGDEHKLHRSVLQYNIGQVYIMLDMIEEGLSYYKSAITADPYYTEYYNDVGNVLQNAGRFAEAIEYYDLAIKYSAPYAEVYHNRGLCHGRVGNWELALASLDTSIELDPSRAETYALRAEALEQLGREEDALADYDKVLELKQDFLAARVNRAILYFNQGSYDRALSDMNEVISIESHEASHYDNRAEIHSAMNRDDLCAADRTTAARYRASA